MNQITYLLIIQHHKDHKISCNQVHEHDLKKKRQ